jgi:hypothetical protein
MIALRIGDLRAQSRAITGVSKMSHSSLEIGTTFAVLPLQANAVSREGMDLIEVSWKLTKKQQEAGITREQRMPKMVYVPSLDAELCRTVSNEAIRADLYTVLLNSIDTQRTAIIRALIESGSNVIPEVSISLEVCVASMLAERESERLNGEKIEAWFKASEPMQACLLKMAEDRAAKQGKAVDVVKAVLHNTYLATVKKLAAPNPGITEADRDRLITVLQGLEDDSALCAALIKRAQNIEYISAL